MSRHADWYPHDVSEKEALLKYGYVQDNINADTGRLYGPIDQAIAYLKELKYQYGESVELDEHWWGYEDMTMRVVWTRPLTTREKRELKADIGRHYQRERQEAEKVKAEKKAKLKAQKAELERKLKELDTRNDQ